MANKLDVRCIIKDHVKTLVDCKNKQSLWDILSFLVIPFLCAFLWSFKGWKLSGDMLNIFVNIGSIFTALFISVLVMISDQCQKLTDKLKALPAEHDETYRELLDERREFMKELFINITYIIIISIFLLTFSLIYQCLNNAKWYSEWVVMPICIFLISNLLLTSLMIIKRTYVCLKLI